MDLVLYNIITGIFWGGILAAVWKIPDSYYFCKRINSKRIIPIIIFITIIFGFNYLFFVPHSIFSTMILLFMFPIFYVFLGFYCKK